MQFFKGFCFDLFQVNCKCYQANEISLHGGRLEVRAERGINYNQHWLDDTILKLIKCWKLKLHSQMVWMAISNDPKLIINPMKKIYQDTMPLIEYIVMYHRQLSAIVNIVYTNWQISKICRMKIRFGYKSRHHVTTSFTVSLRFFKS